VNNKITMIFVALALIVLIILQVVGMKQSDDLYKQINRIADGIRNRPVQVVQVQEGDAKTSEKDKPVDGDWLIYHLTGEPYTLNYIHSTSTMPTSYIVYRNIKESLLEYDIDKYDLVPSLADSYEVAQDGMAVTYKIKPEAHFSDGMPVTADDVVFSFNTVMNEKVDAADHRSYINIVKSVEKIDRLTVKFVMGSLSFKAVEYTGMMLIYPKHIYEFSDPKVFNDRISDPVGSGPFVFKKWARGQEVILERNENYWRKEKMPHLKKIVFRFITNDVAALQSFKAGNLDFMEPLPDQYEELKKDKEFVKQANMLSYWHPGVGYFWMGWNQERPYFKDRKVRLAMTHMIDRELICRKLLDNPDAIVPTGPFYIFGPQSDPDIKPWPYNPQRAKELLDESGWVDSNNDGIRDKGGVDFSFRYMIVSGSYLHEQVGKLVKDSAAKLGIDVSIEPYEWSVFSEKVTGHEFDAVNMAWKSGLAADPYQIWHSSQIENRGSNYISFNNPEADAIIEKARITFDKDERNKLYHEFHRIIHEQQPYTFVYSRPGQRVVDKRFHNVKIHPLGLDEHEWYVPLGMQKYKD